MKQILKFLVGLFALLLLVGLGIGMYYHQPKPTLIENEESREYAMRLGEKMLASVNDSAWQETAAVQWSFGSIRSHLWDRNRHLAKMSWGEYEVLMNLHNQTGVVKKGGEALSGSEKQEALEQAWGFWCNDSFWLNPIGKLFDEGTSLYEVEGRERGRHLLIQYSSGGVTPGDAYLWTVNEEGRALKWEMWVSIVPIGGVEVSWGGWTQLGTGAWVSAKHTYPLGLSVSMENVKGARSLLELTGGKDPFAEMF